MMDWRRTSIVDRRAAVLKLYNSGLSYAQVGVHLGVTTNTIAGMIHRAKEAGFTIRAVGQAARGVAAERAAKIGREKRRKAAESPRKFKGRQKMSPMTGLIKTLPSAPVPKRELRDISLRDDEVREDLILFAEREAKDCAWPMTEPTASMLCCGRPVLKGFNSPYCPDHAARSMPLSSLK